MPLFPAQPSAAAGALALGARADGWMMIDETREAVVLMVWPAGGGVCLP
jgi:hypothetical protein